MKSILSFRGQHSFLSNFYPLVEPIELTMDNGNVYKFLTIENAYQASKIDYKVYGYEQYHKMVVEFQHCSAKKAKSMGRIVSMKNNFDRINTMERLIELKFPIGSSLAQKLLDTNDYTLYEGNVWNDNFWGVDSKTLKGQNWLGVLLMHHREKLRNYNL
jgi:ribA/ribD-fused uncharacterized protein